MSTEYITVQEAEKMAAQSRASRNTVATGVSAAPPSTSPDDLDDTYITTKEADVMSGKKTQTDIMLEEGQPVEQPTVEDIPAESYSIKDLEDDEEFIRDVLQYRQDKYGTEKDVGTGIPVFGRGFGLFEQELTNENIVDDYMDEYRGIIANSINAYAEYDRIKSLNESASLARQEGNIELAAEYERKVATAKRVFQKADNVAGLLDWNKRYEGKSAFQQAQEAFGLIPGYFAPIISDPLTAVSLGAGKLIGSTAQATATRAILQSAFVSGGAEAVAAGGTDLLVQGAEIEMGIKEEIDKERLATVVGVSALTAGALSAYGTRNSLKKINKVSRGSLDEALKKNQETQVAAARETNKKLKSTSFDIRQGLFADVEKTYGAEAVVKDKNGNYVSLNSKVIREKSKGVTKEALGEIDEETFDVAINVESFERVTAGVAEVVEGIKTGSIKLPDEDMAAQLTAPLRKRDGETVSERMFNILTRVEDKSLDEATKIFGKYGITQKELAAVMFAEASIAGQKLNRVSQLAKAFSRSARKATDAELAEEAEQIAAAKLGETFRRLEDIRRLSLVSGIATAVRNNTSQVMRSGIDTLVYGFESGLHQVAGTGRKRFTATADFVKSRRDRLVRQYMDEGMTESDAFLRAKKETRFTAITGGFEHSLAQVRSTFIDQQDSATIAQFILDMNPDQKRRFYAQYSEVRNKLRQKNSNQNALAGKGNGLSKTDQLLDGWEGAVNTFNFFNRLQEAIYRNGSFTASIQRQLYNKGIDMLDVLEAGKITENISEEMVAKAVDDALEFTYASQPKFGPFKTLNNFIVQSGLTLAIPFPRFMFKAIEMTYNYNVTGAGTAALRAIWQKSTTGQVSDGVYRQAAEGLAGGLPMLALGYLLTDPDNDMVGSEWYMLKDGMGNEVDARPFFPLTPYLLIGTMIHRKGRDVPAFSGAELLEGFTGANFRGSGAMSKFTEDMIALLSGEDEVKNRNFANTLGKYLGEAASGYGQPIYQFADIFQGESVRRMDYKEDPNYKNGLSAFMSGFGEPFLSRLDRVPLLGAGIEEEDYAEDPRFADVPERVMPFMKILFGATLSRIPPKYVSTLGQYGFTYRDFMARTNIPSLNRSINREMGYRMNMEMPQVLADLDEARNKDGTLMFDSSEKQAFIADYIRDLKKDVYADVKTMGEDEAVGATIKRFRVINARKRRAAIKKFKENNPFGAKDYDPFNIEHMEYLIDLAKSYQYE
jgi:hypothetical protein